MPTELLERPSGYAVSFPLKLVVRTTGDVLRQDTHDHFRLESLRKQESALAAEASRMRARGDHAASAGMRSAYAAVESRRERLSRECAALQASIATASGSDFFSSAPAESQVRALVDGALRPGYRVVPGSVPVLSVAIPAEPQDVPPALAAYFSQLRSLSSELEGAAAREFIDANVAELTTAISSSGANLEASMKNLVRAFTTVAMLPSAHALADDLNVEPYELLDLTDPYAATAFMLSMSSESISHDARRAGFGALLGMSPERLRKFFAGFDRSDLDADDAAALRSAFAREMISVSMRDMGELRPFDAAVDLRAQDVWTYNGPGDDAAGANPADDAVVQAARFGLSPEGGVIDHRALFTDMPDAAADVLDILAQVDPASHAEVCNDMLDRSSPGKFDFHLPSTHQFLATIRSVFSKIHAGKISRQVSDMILGDEPSTETGDPRSERLAADCQDSEGVAEGPSEDDGVDAPEYVVAAAAPGGAPVRHVDL